MLYSSGCCMQPVSHSTHHCSCVKKGSTRDVVLAVEGAIAAILFVIYTTDKSSGSSPSSSLRIVIIFISLYHLHPEQLIMQQFILLVIHAVAGILWVASRVYLPLPPVMHCMVITSVSSVLCHTPASLSG